MKKKIINILMIISLIVYIPLILNPECPVTPDYSPSPLSGTWKFSLSYSNGESFANILIKINYDGRFCEKLKVADTGEEFYVTGLADSHHNSEVSGRFAESCNNLFFINSQISGSFSEFVGAEYGSGNFSCIQKNSNYKGTWQARRSD